MIQNNTCIYTEKMYNADREVIPVSKICADFTKPHWNMIQNNQTHKKGSGFDDILQAEIKKLN